MGFFNTPLRPRSIFDRHQAMRTVMSRVDVVGEFGGAGTLPAFGGPQSSARDGRPPARYSVDTHARTQSRRVPHSISSAELNGRGLRRFVPREKIKAPALPTELNWMAGLYRGSCRGEADKAPALWTVISNMDVFREFGRAGTLSRFSEPQSQIAATHPVASCKSRFPFHPETRASTLPPQ